MALNKEVFRTRALTAVIFAAVMLAGLLINEACFIALFLAIFFGCWTEYLKIIEKIHDIPFSYYYKAGLICGGLSVALAVHFAFWVIPGYEVMNYLVPVTAIAGFLLLVYNLIVLKKEIFSKASFSALAGVLYISFPIGTILSMSDYGSCIARPGECSLCFNQMLVLFIIVSIWINDTMAYITGSFIGKTPFSKISPKKTWEGTIGGAVLCVAVMALVGKYVWDYHYLPLRHWIIIAALCAVAGTIGDLFESKLKRMAGIKDSGSFMPGHGGFLDRFDSLLFAAPAVWLYIRFFAS